MRIINTKKVAKLSGNQCPKQYLLPILVRGTGVTKKKLGSRAIVIITLKKSTDIKSKVSPEVSSREIVAQKFDVHKVNNNNLCACPEINPSGIVTLEKLMAVLVL